MGLFDDFEEMSDDLFDAFEDFTDIAKITRIISSTKDAQTGIVTNTTEDYENVEIAQRKFRREEFNSIIQSGDVEIRIKANTIPVIVDSNYLIILDSGKTLNIVQVEPRPVTKAILFLCQCREKKG